MHLIETYALNCGLKIDRPYIFEKFFPLDIDKFITLHPSSKFSAKCYDYWQDVVDIILPYLQKDNIHILQIGAKDDAPIRGCLHAHGKTNINQSAYLLSRSLLHAGADSFPAHVASGYNKKIVCLYSNNYAANCRPFWTAEKDCVLFEPDRKELKPSFAADEAPKTINQLNPEDIAEAILNLLNIKNNKKLITLRKGKAYNHPIVELIPNCVVEIKSMGIESIIVRMDLEFSEEVLASQLSKGPCSIVTDKVINLNLLKQFKENIKEFVYLIDKNNDPNFMLEVSQVGSKIILMSEMEDSDIQKVKLNYMDYGIIQRPPSAPQEEIDDLKSRALDTLYYKSKRILISGGKTYKSEAAWRQDLNSEPNDSTPAKVIDSPCFWDSLEEYYLLEERS